MHVVKGDVTFYNRTKYAQHLQKLITVFEMRFQIFTSEKAVLGFNVSSSPFNTETETVSDWLLNSTNSKKKFD